jgi:Tfp pilus assembly protein PilV
MSLVEVMIALVVMLLVFFALMQTALVGIDSNMLNSLRSEAVNVAEIRMNEVRNTPFTAIDADGGSPATTFDSATCTSGCNDCPSGFSTGECRCRNVKSISSFHFCTNVACTEIGGDGICATDNAGGDNKQVTVSVGWKWKGNDYTHFITTIKTR